MKTLILFFIPIFGISQTWNTTGNSGTNPNVNFLGTTDNQNLVIKTNNTEKLRITTAGRVLVLGLDNAYGWNNNFFFGGGNETVTGVGNYSFGIGTMNSLTSGQYNSAFGGNALKSLTTGSFNSAFGINSLLLNTTGSNNTGLGAGTLDKITTGSWNVAVGTQALSGGSGTNNTGNYNTAIGADNMRGLLTSSSYNTSVGGKSFIFLRTGNNNIAIGYNNATAELQNANNNIYIGNNLQATSSSPNNELNIGNWIVGNNGTIGIGSFTNPLPANGVAQDGETYKLFVKDGIKTEKLKVDIAASNGWADYVFKKDYKLRTLAEVEKFIAENGHLPEVPSEKEAIEKGIELKAMNILLLKKVEELTLYTLLQQKSLDEQNIRIELLEKKLNEK